MQPAPGRPATLIKPTLDSLYHIDYEWWERSGKDLNQALIAQLPQYLRDNLSARPGETTLDYVDPATAEVTPENELMLAIRMAAQGPEFVTPQTSITDAIFRSFAANGNQPMSVNELGVLLARPPQTILKMLSGREVYYGLRPVR
ncbi:MAG: hypothetical protein JNL34_17945 [Anaerolineae bacterium]|nr:hypothetical protein [Anaerolineae bacterium]